MSKVQVYCENMSEIDQLGDLQDGGGQSAPLLDGASPAGTMPPATALDITPPAPAQSDPEAKRMEHKRTPDMQEMMDANTVIIRSLALQEHRRKPPAINEAQMSLAYLGSILAQPKGKNLQAQLRQTDGKGGFSETEGLPRVQEVITGSGGTKPVTSFDRRASDADVEPTKKKRGEYDLRTFTGRGQDGLLGFFCQGEDDDDKRNFQFADRDFIQIYLVTQKRTIAKGLADAASGAVPFAKPSALTDPHVLAVLSTQIGNADQFVGNMEKLRSSDPSADVDLMKGITPEQLKAALEKTGISVASVLAFAEKMKACVLSDRWEGSADDKKANGEAIDKIIRDLESGLQPTAGQIQDLLRIGARSELNRKQGTLQAAIDKIDSQLAGRMSEEEQQKLKNQKAHLENQRKNIRDFHSGGRDSLYRRYLDAAVNGEVDQADRDWLQQTLAEASEPTAVLGDFDLENTEYLPGKARKHFLKEMPKDPKEKAAWLSKFLTEHGGDIAMMLLYTFIQMAADVVKTSVDKT